METKKLLNCYLCKKKKNSEFFSNDSSRTSGKMSKCKDCAKIKTTERKWANKLKIIDHYGGRCACCGETEVKFLTLDHMENNGDEQRYKIFGSRTGGSRFYAWVIKNNYPDDLQILCWNCNCTKGIWGECPHKSTDV